MDPVETDVKTVVDFGEVTWGEGQVPPCRRPGLPSGQRMVHATWGCRGPNGGRAIITSSALSLRAMWEPFTVLANLPLSYR